MLTKWMWLPRLCFGWQWMHACSNHFCWEIHRNAPDSPLFAIDFRNLHRALRGWNSTLEGCGKAADQSLAMETTCRPPFVVETQKGGLPARKSARPTTFCPWILVFLQQMQERGIARYFQQMCARPLSHHCTSSRECSPRPSGHQSRISMHDGRGVGLHDLMWHECTNRHLKPTTLSWIVKSVGDRESRHVSSLRVWNAPRFPCLG